MRKLYKLFVVIVACMMLVTPAALASDEKVVTIGGSQPYREIGDFMMVENLVGGGNVFYVDSGVSSSGNGTSWSTAKSTLDAAVVLCTANSGDVILVAPGHAENLSAANAVDLDVAGITVIGLSDGASAPTFTFTGTAGEFVLGAASVVVQGLRFKPGISDVVMGVSVEAAADNCTIKDCEFVVPGTATFEFLDAIDVAALADDLTIQNVKYRDGATSACNHFVEAGAGVNTNLRILDCDIFGRFAVSAIWSNAIDTGVLIANNMISNTISGQHCIEFTTTASGMIVNNNLYGDTEASILDPGSMYIAGNTISTAIDLDGIPRWVIDNGLNHLVALDGTGAYPEQAANDSIIAKICAKGATATLSTYNNTTDSLEAIRDQVDTLNTADQVDLDAILADTSAMQPSAPYAVSKTLTTIMSGNNDLFVVTGTVKIKEIIGIVTSGIEAKSCLINYNMDPTSPAGDTVFGTDGTALEINGDAAGALYTWNGVVANDLVATDNGVALGLPTESGIIVPAGSLELAAVVATSAAGTVVFSVRYEPVSPGATVTAAP